MRKNVLMNTIILACIVIIAGFSCIFFINYRQSMNIFEQEVTTVSNLTAEGISRRIDALFSKPINTAVTMANDTFLHKALMEEKANGADDEFVQTMREYLDTYRKKYNYDSVFLVSDHTKNYYHFNGVSHVVNAEVSGNEWYFEFLKDPSEYDINVANDESSGNRLVVFINCKVKDSSGNILGVVGAGFDIDRINDIFKYYESNASALAYLITDNGDITMATDSSEYKRSNLFSRPEYAPVKDCIMDSDSDNHSTWYESHYIVTQYIPMLKWHIVVDSDISPIMGKMKAQLRNSIIVLFAILLLLILLIVGILHRNNKQIVRIIAENEKAHDNLFETAVKKMYDNIYEINITKNCAESDETRQFFRENDCSDDAVYDDVLKAAAQKQVHPDYRDIYIETFCTQNIIQQHVNGVETVSCDVMMTSDEGRSYYWMRIIARIFYWDEDESVRMFVYRQNIDLEKLAQRDMVKKMESDSLTGLYNKVTTQNYIYERLESNMNESYALFIMDIDDFKSVNDTCGHSVGDKVIVEFGEKIKLCFDNDTVIGRVGGDEFIAFAYAPSEQWVNDKGAELVRLLEDEYFEGDKSCRVSSSIGIAVSPDAGDTFETLYKNADYALYQTKKRGKNGFTVFKA